jgi:hypothetical protein
MALTADIRRYRKLVKQVRPSRVHRDDLRQAFMFFFDGKFYANISVNLPTNMICERIATMRDRYEEDMTYIGVWM